MVLLVSDTKIVFGRDDLEIQSVGAICGAQTKEMLLGPDEALSPPARFLNFELQRAVRVYHF